MAQPSPCPASAPSVLSGPSPTKEEQEQDQEPDKTDKAREQEPEEQQQQQQQLEQEIQHQTEAEHPLSGGACIQQDAALTDVVSTSTIPTSTLIPIATSNTLANDAPSLTLKSAFPGSSATAASVHATVLFAPDQGSTAPSVDPPPPSTPHTNPTEVPPEAPTHLSNGHHGGYPSGYPSGYHNIESTPTPPAPSPSPSVVASATNGLGDVAPSASPSPMSNAPPPPGHPRQHINYAGQATYHQPVMNPAPYGYQVATSQGADPYRGSQPLPPNPALALPSMRSLDSLQQQQQQQQQHQHHHHQHQQQAMSMTAPIPAQYYSQPAMPMNPYGMHPDYRFTALPMGDPRVALSGGRHKKEIKRRTKTGCLTCRKRRIKCDETQPTCNNCKKSKRECAGYDPIFKQTQQINAPSIQGAPNNQPSPGSASLSSAAANANANLNANTYGSQPAVVSSNYSQPQVHGHPFDPSSLASTVEYHSGGAIDPALDPAKKMKVDELLGLGGPAPPAPTSPPDQALVDEITKIYYEIYVPGLGSFFESTWYNFTPDGPNSIKIIHDNKELVSLFASFLDSLSQIKTTDDPQMAMTGNLEMRVVWGLTTLARSVPEATNPHSSEPLPQDDPTETRARLTVFEALLSGINLTENPCVQPPKTGDPHRIREFEFWFYLAEYLRLHADGQSKTPQLRDTALTRIRSLLDGRENRDVLYSIAILRELSPLFPPGYESQVPKHLDESDPRNRLAVASRFIKDEALTTGGTTNVVRRFAELATKAFITPGVNIARRA